jgi:membrane-associated phospholipid phosphatase
LHGSFHPNPDEQQHRRRESTASWLADALLCHVALLQVFYRKHSLTRALHAFGHAFFCCLTVFVLVLALTEATKPYASRLRPDFLYRCNPTNAKNVKNATALIGYEAACGQKDEDKLKDGRLSFPSGHSSNSMSVCWFTTLYLVYSLYWREGSAYLFGLHKRRGCCMRFCMEVCNALFYLWSIGLLALSWFVGVSRYHDNRHHISDIVGGFFLAVIVTTPYFLTYAGQLQYYAGRIDEEEQGLERLPSHYDAKDVAEGKSSGQQAACGTQRNLNAVDSAFDRGASAV